MDTTNEEKKCPTCGTTMTGETCPECNKSAAAEAPAAEAPAAPEAEAPAPEATA